MSDRLLSFFMFGLQPMCFLLTLTPADLYKPDSFQLLSYKKTRTYFR